MHAFVKDKLLDELPDNPEPILDSLFFRGNDIVEASFRKLLLQGSKNSLHLHKRSFIIHINLMCSTFLSSAKYRKVDRTNQQ